MSRSVADSIGRFVAAVLGGATLSVPVIIMALHTSRTARSTTVCAAVLLFALMLSVGTRGTNQEIHRLGATAAYAAVTVVYIGTAGAT